MANKKTFDYSKWDKIELSDDESDLHPNIDKDSWFRLKHRTRLEREEKEDREVKELESKNVQDNNRLKLIESKLNRFKSGQLGEDAEFEDFDALEVEIDELKTAIRGRLDRIEEIREKRKWNIDNICKTKEEKTIVNSAQSSSLAAKDIPIPPPSNGSDPTTIKPPTATESSTTATKSIPTVNKIESNITPKVSPSVTVPTTPPQLSKGSEPSTAYSKERLSVMTYNDYVLKHEQILETYSEIADMEATKEYLFKHCDVLLHEHSQSYMLLSSLEDEMNGKKKRMRLVCRQSQILSHIQELGVSMKRDPRDVVLPFFKRIEEKAYLTGFLGAVDDFIRKIQARAVEKRKEMDAERLKEQADSGALDPYEVLQSLPTALKEAFESQDIQKLQDVLANMDPKEAKQCMKKCVDSGLWVPKDSSVFEDEDGEEVEGEEEEGDEVVEN
mmetsp:Transcript_30300/g.43322  ORF Transcript_30300/g.43322 Transcript_30300/m.43322 type:complete len:444 (+) Transcript_30300:41-1372(+)